MSLWNKTDFKRRLKIKKLFSVTVFVNNYTHGVHIYNNLRIAIIRATGNQSLYDEAEYREMIEGYDDLDETSKTYSKGCIDENFTKDEAEKVRAYFKTRIEKGEKITIRKAELPIPGNYMPIGAMSFGGSNDLISIYKSKSYPLEFKILGYYSILNLKPVDVDKQELEKEMAEVKVKEEPISKVRQKVIKAYEKKYPGENIKLLKEEKCNVKSCKKEPTIFARFLIDRYALGLRGDQGASITVCKVVTCAKHSFKDNRNLLQKYMDRLRKDAIEW